MNERDELGDDVPFEYATRVREGKFYGWPWYYIGNHEDLRLKDKRPDLADKVEMPDVLIQAHSAPLGITFYTGNGFPTEYKGDAFVALHGSWNRGKRTGYKVVRLLFKDNEPTGVYEDFATGFVIRTKRCGAVRSAWPLRRTAPCSSATMAAERSGVLPISGSVRNPKFASPRSVFRAKIGFARTLEIPIT